MIAGAASETPKVTEWRNYTFGYDSDGRFYVRIVLYVACSSFGYIHVSHQGFLTIFADVDIDAVKPPPSIPGEIVGRGEVAS